MSLLEIILVALALAADAFTVGLAVGLRHQSPRQIFRLSFHFGLFQALLPLAGALFGNILERWIDPWTHLLACGLLLFIGLRMFVGALKKDDETKDVDLTRGVHLVGLSLAVSIDAFAIGFTLGLREVSIALAVIIIGIVAAALTVVGMKLAGRVKHTLGKRAEMIAGLVLIGLGIKVFLDHYLF